jgi:hypothetical protein
MQLTMHLNEHSDFYYNFIHGDKETFHMAWRMLGQEYAMVPWPVHQLHATMCQHDFEGNRLFQHRNLAKWVAPPGENRRIDGFEREDLCLSFLAELADSPDSTGRPDRAGGAEGAGGAPEPEAVSAGS